MKLDSAHPPAPSSPPPPHPRSRCSPRCRRRPVRRRSPELRPKIGPPPIMASCGRFARPASRSPAVLHFAPHSIRPFDAAGVTSPPTGVAMGGQARV